MRASQMHVLAVLAAARVISLCVLARLRYTTASMFCGDRTSSASRIDPRDPELARDPIADSFRPVRTAAARLPAEP